MFERLVERAWEYRDAYHSVNLTRLASLFLQRHDQDKAADMFDLAMRLNPHCSFTLHKFGAFLYRKGVEERGIGCLIKANHMPAFMTLMKLATRYDKYTIQALFDKIEFVKSSSLILPAIRYIMYLYSVENNLMAKASLHLQALYILFH